MKKRISENEKYLDESLDFIKKLDDISKLIDKIKPKLQKLDEYYGSTNWFKDIEEYDKNEINIKAGVLSEDAVWNMNCDLDELLREVHKKIEILMKERNPMKTIVLASNNKHKIKEIKEILTDYKTLPKMNEYYTWDGCVKNPDEAICKKYVEKDVSYEAYKKTYRITYKITQSSD